MINTIKNILADRELEEVKELWNTFFYRIIIRVIWPIVPICLEIFIRVLINKQVTFPNQTVLVLAFILPSSYLPDFKTEISINLISMLCLIATVPFFCSIVSNQGIVFWMGFILFVFFLILFLLLDFLKTYKSYSKIIEQR